ncbi:MAG TPA: hypothetical protein VHM28_09910 [Anaerolineales bacterium]|jgi:hypothetical protein|nr:hypothetical protein [Anaerolineales bacterium]
MKMLSEIEDAISKAWLEAAVELGINVEPHFVLSVDGQNYIFIALIREFGGQKGTLICPINDWKIYSPIAKSYGYYCSALANSYTKYQRTLFIETLDDWGWFGTLENKPSWYTGKPWGEDAL